MANRLIKAAKACKGSKKFKTCVRAHLSKSKKSLGGHKRRRHHKRR